MPLSCVVFDRRLDPAARTPVCVAVSGGADSLLALIETVAWAQKNGRPVIALSVNHGLQADSAAWTERARMNAVRLGCGFRTLAWTGPKPVTGLPDAARQARHRLLADEARNLGARVIITGHTGDDALENAMMDQSALAEWGPSPVWPEGRGLYLLRPLLNVRRAQARARLQAEGWAYIDDPANENLQHPRIRARNAIAGQGAPPAPPVPDPQAEALAKAAYLGQGYIRLPRQALAHTSLDAGRIVLGCACLSVGGGGAPPRRARLESLSVRIRDKGDFTATLSGAKITVDQRHVLITRDVGEYRRKAAPVLARPGVWDGRFAITALADGVSIVPLAGRIASLSRDEQGLVRTLPAAVRPGLPAAVWGEQAACPSLTSVPGVDIHGLVAHRFLTACGVMTQENATPPSER